MGDLHWNFSLWIFPDKILRGILIALIGLSPLEENMNPLLFSDQRYFPWFSVIISSNIWHFQLFHSCFRCWFNITDYRSISFFLVCLRRCGLTHHCTIILIWMRWWGSWRRGWRAWLITDTRTLRQSLAWTMGVYTKTVVITCVGSISTIDILIIFIVEIFLFWSFIWMHLEYQWCQLD